MLLTEKFRYYWQSVVSSLWFIPLLMCIAAVGLAVLLLNLNISVTEGEGAYWLLHSGTPENARTLLGALLAGMITMTSLVISITMVVLTLAAGQIGPRLIRSFMHDRITQTVLGLFLADIFYLLVVFRTVDTSGNGTAPHLAVSFGTLATALCLLLLLFFIHRLARSIVYDHVVREVASELRQVVDRLMSEPSTAPNDEAPTHLTPDPAWIAVKRDGNVQAVEFDRLIQAARKHGAVLSLNVQPGDFVFEGYRCVAVHPASAHSDELCALVHAALIIGSERTMTQDLRYGIRLLVEIATRALSPGLNDLFTAEAAIDNLSAALIRILSRDPEPASLHDREGRVRVVRPTVSHAEMIGTAFDGIRQSGAGAPIILLRLADAIGRITPFARTDSQRAALLEQLDMVLAANEKNKTLPRDAALIRTSSRDARTSLQPARSDL